MGKPDDVAGSFFALFGDIHDKFLRPGEKITRPRLSPAQFHALTNLRHEGPLPISELASELKISKQQITPLLGKLIENGLVVRRTDEHDRRIVRIEITAAGRSTVENLWAEVKLVIAGKLEVLPEADLDELSQIIRRMREILCNVT
jgi:DNA-binding MarR family transcriptional regulator